MTDYVCPDCGCTIALVTRFPPDPEGPPSKLHAFCFECGEWVDFEKEQSR